MAKEEIKLWYEPKRILSEFAEAHEQFFLVRRKVRFSAIFGKKK